MRRIRIALARVAGMYTRDRGADDVREELESHLEMATAENVRRGMAPAEARRQALLAAGGMMQAAEAVRDRRGLPWLENAAGDARYAVRALRRNPGFAAAVVGVLAVGIGANAAVFGVTDAVLLRPLPFSQAERLVHVWPERFLAQREVTLLRERARALEEVGSYSPGWLMSLTGVDEPEQLNAARVSGNFFELLGARPALGRVFGMAAEAPGAEPVAVLDWRLWRTKFGADTALVGRTIQLEGGPVLVVGVMPREFQFMDNATQLWLPLAMDREAMSWAGGITQGVARLAPGVTPATATQELRALTERARAEYGVGAEYGRDADVVALRESLLGGTRPMLIAVLAAVGLVLLIATVNVANLLLVRATDRRVELAVRAALGATRGRIARQLLTESLVLGVVGGALGILLAVAGLALLRGLLPPETPRLAEIAVDGRMLAFALVLTIGVTALFGSLPSLAAARQSIVGRLRQDRSVAGHRPARRALVTVEVALALVLLAGAVLMLRTVQALNDVDPGFRSDRVLTMRLQQSMSEPDAARAYWREVMDRLAALPGVEVVGTVLHLPMSGRKWQAPVEVDGRPLPAGVEPPRTAWQVVGGDYFDVIGTPLLRGRRLDGRDHFEAPRTMVVNEAFARLVFPGEDPLARRVRAGNATGTEWFTIVGVVGSVRHDSLTAPPPPEIYVSIEQRLVGSNSVAMRTTGDPLTLAAPVRDVIWSIDADIPISQVQSLDQLVARSTAARRFVLMLLGAFALIAIVLGVVGIWGVVAFTVRQRTRELGLRMALGSSPAAAVRLVMTEGVLFALVGIVIGGLASLAVGRVLAGLLWGVAPVDATTLVAAPAALLAVASLAAWLPARRAARLDPATVLRE
ncbi:MAG TPA: ABC transporter permease [Longimicrobiales bacterium]